MEAAPTVTESRHSADPFPYQPNSELAKQPGFWPNIDESQQEALDAMYERWNKLSLNNHTSGEHPTMLLLRFLRAKNFNVERAWTMLQNDLEWRQTNNIGQLIHQSPDEVLQCNAADIYRFFPTWLQGFDKQGRSVSYRQYGHFEIWELLKLTTMERLLRFHVWEIEQQLQLLHKQTELTKHTIETFILVIDAANWGWRLATRDAFTYVRGMAEIDGTHFPERLGRVFVINAPAALSFAWKMISTWIDPVTRDKISILSAPADWQPALFEHVDQSQVPEMYGGFAPDPQADVLQNFNPDAMIEEYKNSQNIVPIAPEIILISQPNSPRAILALDSDEVLTDDNVADILEEDEDQDMDMRPRFKSLKSEPESNGVTYMDYVLNYLNGVDHRDSQDTASVDTTATNLDHYHTPRGSEDGEWRRNMMAHHIRIAEKQKPQMVDACVQTETAKIAAPHGCCTIS